MSYAGHQNDFTTALEATRRERDEIEAQIASLRSRRDALLVREERLRCMEEGRTVEPYLVRVNDLVRLLGISRDGIEKLKENRAKGFPKAIYGMDSFPRWNWIEVQNWIESQRA